MAALQLLTDAEIYDGVSRMFTTTNPVKSTRLNASTLSHSHFVIERINAKHIKGSVSGTKKFTFEVKSKKSGILLIAKPVDNVDSAEIRELIIKLIIKQDKDRIAFEKREEENKKLIAAGKDPKGFRLQPPIGFSVRSLKQIDQKYHISVADSERNFKTAVKSGYFHKKFMTNAKRHHLLCIFKSA